MTCGWRAAVGWIGVGLQIAVGLPYLVSGLVVPQPWVAGFWLVWALLLVVALGVRARRPLWTPLVAVASIVLWWALVSLGGAFLGWTA